MTFIGPMTNELINSCVEELKRPENKKKISKNIVDPIVSEITLKLWPYFTAHILIQMVIVIVLIYLISVLKRKAGQDS